MERFERIEKQSRSAQRSTRTDEDDDDFESNREARSKNRSLLADDLSLLCLPIRFVHRPIDEPMKMFLLIFPQFFSPAEFFKSFSKSNFSMKTKRFDRSTNLIGRSEHQSDDFRRTSRSINSREQEVLLRSSS